MTGLLKLLHEAGKTYSAAARKVEASLGGGALTPPASQRLVGLGIASEWARHAAAMKGIKFSIPNMNKPAQSRDFIETIRFSFAWSGFNAIFSRDDLLSRIRAPVRDSEIERFRVLYDAAAIPAALITQRTTALHNILKRPIATRMLSIPNGVRVTVLYSLTMKYLTPASAGRGVGKQMLLAAISGNLARIDLPTMVYALRNWTVHGGAVDTNFRSRPDYATFVQTILETAAEVHLATARCMGSGFHSTENLCRRATIVRGETDNGP